MALFAYNDPMLSDVERTIDRMLDRGFGRWGVPSFTRDIWPTTAEATIGPELDVWPRETTAWGGVGGYAFDVIEKKDGYELIADAPGFESPDITVNLDGDVLTISGKREIQEKEEEGGRVWRRERRRRRFTRSFTLPNDAKHEDIKATLDKGVLHVCVPKMPEKARPEPKRIEVQHA